jgi:hypothetical protein
MHGDVSGAIRAIAGKKATHSKSYPMEDLMSSPSLHLCGAGSSLILKAQFSVI